MTDPTAVWHDEPRGSWLNGSRPNPSLSFPHCTRVGRRAGITDPHIVEEARPRGHLLGRGLELVRLLHQIRVVAAMHAERQRGDEDGENEARRRPDTFERENVGPAWQWKGSEPVRAGNLPHADVTLRWQYPEANHVRSASLCQDM